MRFSHTYPTNKKSPRINREHFRFLLVGLKICEIPSQEQKQKRFFILISNVYKSKIFAILHRHNVFKFDLLLILRDKDNRLGEERKGKRGKSYNFLLCIYVSMASPFVRCKELRLYKRLRVFKPLLHYFNKKLSIVNKLPCSMT